MHDQCTLPFPPLQPSFPVAVRSVYAPRRQGLVPLDAAKPADFTALVSTHHANFECNETVRPELEGFFMEGRNGPEAVGYENLEGQARATAAEIALEQLFLAPCIHATVLSENVVHEPLFYDLYVFSYADVRIVIDAEALSQPAHLFADLDMYGAEAVRPCVIEVHGKMPPLVRTMTAERHLRHALSLLPEPLKPAGGTFRIAHG